MERGLIHIEIPEFILVAINLFVLYIILRKVLFKKVTAFMEQRSNMIQDSLNSADKAKAYADEVRTKYEEQLKVVQDEMQKMMEEAKIKASKESDKLIASAKKEAEDFLKQAREEIERERNQMVKQIRTHVADLAISAASKVIQANMDNEKNRKLVDKFIDEAGAA